MLHVVETRENDDAEDSRERSLYAFPLREILQQSPQFRNLKWTNVSDLGGTRSSLQN